MTLGTAKTPRRQELELGRRGTAKTPRRQELELGRGGTAKAPRRQERGEVLVVREPPWCQEGREEPGERLDDLAHGVIGAPIEVHRVLGPGYLESVYEEALCLELDLRGIRFARQRPFAVKYKGNSVGEGRLDLLIEDALVVELKTVESLLPIHKAQALSYLKALDLPLALLINFKTTVLRAGIQRVVRSKSP